MWMEREGVLKDLRQERMKSLHELWVEYRKEESMWLHKSYLKWLRVGDCNTRFFHRACKVRVACNNMESIFDNGELCDGSQRIKEVIFYHFQNFFKSRPRGRIRFAVDGLCKLTAEECGLLEENFSYDDIWAAVIACDGNKAPGPDGFNFTFVREFWSMVRGDVMRMFQEFCVHGKLVKGLNASFMALIPKKHIPEGVYDYRPINLIGSIYKLIAKVFCPTSTSHVVPFVSKSVLIYKGKANS